MKKYKILMTEVRAFEAEVEAETKEEAKEMFYKNQKGEIELDIIEDESYCDGYQLMDIIESTD